MAIRHLHDLSVVGNVTVATTGVTNNVLLTSTDTSAASAPDLVLYRNALIADSDTLGVLEFQGRNGMVTSSTAPLTYGAIYGRVFDASENHTGLGISANKGNGSGAFVDAMNITLKGTNNSAEGAVIINPSTTFELPDSNLEVKGSYGITTESHGSSANWKQAYDNHITGVAVTGTSTKTITLTQRDGGTISANFSDQSGSGGITMTNGVNDRIVTAASSTSVNGESGLLFGGSYLEITPGNIATPLQVKRTSASTRQVNLLLSANDGTTTSEGFLGIDSGADLRYGASSNTSTNSLVLTEDNLDFVVSSSTNNAIVRLAGGGTNFANFNIGGLAGAITVNSSSNSITIGHHDTSSSSSVNNSNGTVIQDVTLDTYGHVTGLGSVDLDGRYVNVAGDTMTNDLNVTGIIKGTEGFSTDGNNKFYTWRAIQNTSNSSNQYYRIARISGSQSSRFIIELAGRSSSYGDTSLPAFGKIVGQLNNDNNYDIVYYNASATDEVVDEVGQVDVDTTRTDIYVRVGQFSELTATAHISDGTITPYDTNSGSTSAPTNYVQATEYKLWNTGNDGSGSGLDADTLDGIQGASFLRSNTADTATGALTFSGATFFNGNIGNSPSANPGVHIGISAGGDGQIQIIGTSAHIDFSNAGSEDYDARIILEGNDELNVAGVGNNFQVNGYRVLTTLDEGSGNGIDADTVDGIQSSRIIYGSNDSGTNEGVITDWNNVSKSGFYSDDGASNRWSTSNWSSIIHHKLYDNNNNYASQIGFDTYDAEMYYRMNNAGTWTSWQRIFMDDYHPNADKWTTARTITLGGDLSGSVSIDGSANVTLNAQVTNNSHTHDDRYYTETESDARFLRKDTDETYSRKRFNFGASTNWDAVGFGNLTNVHMQGHNQFWIGAGNGTWFAGTANTKNSASGLAADANQAHDLLISTMQSTSTTDRGITFAVDSGGSGNSGYRLGKWHSSNEQHSSKLTIDGGLNVRGGDTANYDYYADDYSTYWDNNGGQAYWGGDANWIDPSITAGNAIQIQAGNLTTNSNNPALQFHQYGYGGVQMRYDGPSDVMHLESTGSNRYDYFQNTTDHGYIQIGPMNTSHAHIYTDRPNFYFNKELRVNNQQVFHTGYHPNADKWTTARTLSLTGDVTGSVSWDGSANASITTAVANNSHEHTKLHEESTITYGGSYLQWTDLSGNGGAGTNGNAPGNPFSDWHHHLIMNHGNSGGYYVDMAFSFHNDRVHFRRLENGSFGSWREFFHTGHLPTWSEIASKPSTFAPSSHNHDDRYYTESESDAKYLLNTSDVLNGELNVTRNSGTTGSSAPGYSSANIELQTSSNHVPAISFHRGGYSASTLYEYDGELYVNPWTTRAQAGKLLSSGNFDDYVTSTYINNLVSSSSDASTLDGMSPKSATGAAGSNQILRTHSNGYLYMQNWIDIGGAGLYSTSGSGNGAHLYPNTVSDYGAWRMNGARNGWNGITFDPTNVTLMANADRMGFYNDADNEWMIDCNRNGSVDMYYDGTMRLWTKSTGIGIAGGITSTGSWSTTNGSYGTQTIGFYYGAAYWNNTGLSYYIGNLTSGSNVQNKLYVKGSIAVGSATASSTYGRIDASNDIVAYSSDKRLKENILPINGALDKISKLSGFTYNWNEKAKEEAAFNTEERLVGVFAQDVQEVLPEAVKLAPFDNDGSDVSKSGEDYLTVQYEKIVPLLIEGMKEQQAQIEKLTTILEEVTKQLNNGNNI